MDLKLSRFALGCALAFGLNTFVGCGDNSSTKAGNAEKIQNKSIAGVSQKGPFVTGSVVRLYELDGEYAQTGKSFTGKISSDNGEFTVPNVTLASQYALLEANGYFRNEVTGEKSLGTITLNALTDLSDRENVNINLLTHLEYERALYLVGMGLSVPAAKKQAETEIFNAFGILGDFENAEDLNIFSEGEGNAALLAFSVLMQGERNEAELTELLTKFATDIEMDGEWNDEATKMEIADWAMEQDFNNGLASIRSNINGWNLGTAPDFEKYVRNFWYMNYGLGVCDKDSEGVVKPVANPLSKEYGNKFYCSANGWVNLEIWSWDVPKEVRLNPNIAYSSMTDERDGQTYKTVTIGTQTWMAENLNYADSVNTPSLMNHSWCYDDDPKKCAVTGRFYSFAAAIDSVALANDKDNPQFCGVETDCDRLSDENLALHPIQGICPEGWHLPSNAEWNILIAYAGGDSVAGTKLKSTGGWGWSSIWGDFFEDNGTDDFGFSALPAGIRESDTYTSFADFAYFWSASQYYAINLCIGNEYRGCGERTFLEYLGWASGISIRCIKNSN